MQEVEDEEEYYEEIVREDAFQKGQNWIKNTFKDVTPVAFTQTENEDDIGLKFNIQYSCEYLEGMQIFYGVQQKQEFSKRVLELTKLLIYEASSFYTLWEYRWQCFLALEESLHTEWDFCLQVLNLSPKNYQLFNHRRKCFEHLFKAGDVDVTARELEFCSIAIDRDAKNYHAWSHRWYVLNTTKDLNLLKQEILYCADRIQDDPFNNSAWNQRFSVFQNFKLSEIDFEIDFALSQIERAPSNESGWIYIQGLLRSCDYQQDQVDKVCESCVSVIQRDGRYIHACNTLAKIAEVIKFLILKSVPSWWHAS
eukprot:TRINITY_DN33785_c0_g1_i3.p1 TRINITY_DN33785_c0_g1~~TRINITY_DN33785_c0_g1_i3.p1  ORF type:complete len:310 (+),score=27.46 TRINITY_DN33785_c0_g1_i3:166-1095(+)